MKDLIIGIDPGLSGALCFLSDECVTHDMPTLSLLRGGKNKREIDPHTLTDLLFNSHASHAFVEQIGAMPGQGVTSMFAMGKGYGIIIGALAAVGIPYTFVSPRKWKTALGVPASKDGARSRASQLFPAAAEQWRLVKHDGRAESACIALWGVRQLHGVQSL